jgi:pyruvate,water dikinase
MAKKTDWRQEMIVTTEGIRERVQAGGLELQGIAASAGQFMGRVCVIKGVSEFHKLRSGDILVCAILSPDWLTLLGDVGALITDHGGVLSSSLTIARERGIPAVVATGVATAQLSDGQMVEVDGGRGFARIHTSCASGFRARAPRESLV